MEPERGMQTEWVFYDGDCGFCHRWVRPGREAGSRRECVPVCAQERRNVSISGCTGPTRGSAGEHSRTHAEGSDSDPVFCRAAHSGTARRRLASDRSCWAACTGRDQGCRVPVHRSRAAWGFARAGVGVPCDAAGVPGEIWTVERCPGREARSNDTSLGGLESAPG